MCYFDMLFRFTDEVVDTITHHLKQPKLGRVDAVVGIGLSGTMPLVPVMKKSGLPVIAMRKTGTNSHGGLMASSEFMDKTHMRYVILDDFVCSGATLTSLRDRLKLTQPNWECAGVILYTQFTGGCTFKDVPVLGVGGEIRELHKLRNQEETP